MKKIFLRLFSKRCRITNGILRPLLNLKQGFTTIEMIVCLGVVIQLLVLFSSYVQKNTDHLLDNLAAQQLATVHKAARYYVQDHFTDLFESFNSRGGQGAEPISLALEDLKAEHYLPEEQGEKNVYQQGYGIAVFFQDMGVSGTPTIQETILQLLVYTEKGSSLKEANLRAIANSVGGPGGYVSTTDPKVIMGACQGWKLELPSEISISTGHNVAVSYLSQKNMLPADSFLRRFSISGNSDLSIMHTHLGMDQKFKVQFLDTDANEDLNGNAAQRTFLDKDRLQFGEKCYLTEAGLVLKDDDGNEMILSAESITFSCIIGNHVPEVELDVWGLSFSSGSVHPSYGYYSPSSIRLEHEGSAYFQVSQDGNDAELIMGTNEEISLKSRSSSMKLSRGSSYISMDPYNGEGGSFVMYDYRHDTCIGLFTYGVQDAMNLPPTSLNSSKNGLWNDPYGTDAPYLYLGNAWRTDPPAFAMITTDGYIHRYGTEGTGHNSWTNMSRDSVT